MTTIQGLFLGGAAVYTVYLLFHVAYRSKRGFVPGAKPGAARDQAPVPPSLAVASASLPAALVGDLRQKVNRIETQARDQSRLLALLQSQVAQAIRRDPVVSDAPLGNLREHAERLQTLRREHFDAAVGSGPRQVACPKSESCLRESCTDCPLGSDTDGAVSGRGTISVS